VTTTPLRTLDIEALLNQTLAVLDLPADWVGMRVERGKSTQRSQRDGHPEANSQRRSLGAMVEVMVQGQLGYVATPDVSVAGLRRAAQQACQQAQSAAPWSIHRFEPTLRPPVQGIYYSPVAQPLEQLDAAAVHDLLHHICQGLKVSDQIVQASASVGTQAIDTWLATSNGSRVHQRFDFLTLHFGATAQDGPVVQTRNFNGPRAHCYQGGGSTC
jgi:predicted Zn-dependent protease